jgi:hypothetical protein
MWNLRYASFITQLQIDSLLQGLGRDFDKYLNWEDNYHKEEVQKG